MLILFFRQGIICLKERIIKFNAYVFKSNRIKQYNKQNKA